MFPAGKITVAQLWEEVPWHSAYLFLVWKQAVFSKGMPDYAEDNICFSVPLSTTVLNVGFPVLFFHVVKISVIIAE